MRHLPTILLTFDKFYVLPFSDDNNNLIFIETFSSFTTWNGK